MSKTKAILIVVAVLVFGTAILYFLAGGKTPSGVPLLNYLPFGEVPEGNTPDAGEFEENGGSPENGPNGETGAPRGDIPSFFKLSDAPVAGYIAYTATGTPWVRYVDRATGHVNDVNIQTLEKIKIYNNTTPKIYAAVFRPNATGFVERQLVEGGDVIINTSLMLEAPKSTSTDNLYTAKSSTLRGNIGSIFATPDGNLVYNLVDTGDVIISPFAGDKPKVLFNTSFSEWRLSPLGQNAALLFTKPSASSVGYAYSLSLSNGSLNKLLGPLTALTVKASSDGRRLLYSYLDGSNKNILSAATISNQSKLDIYPVTLPEKCVWSRKSSTIIICGVPEAGLGGNAPDEWYLGLSHYADMVWRFNVETDTAEVLLDPKKNYGRKIDIIYPELSSNEDYLYFMNKDDLSLWALKIGL